MCSMWLDGRNGAAAHLDQHLSPAPLAQLQAWGRHRSRDWLGRPRRIVQEQGLPERSARRTPYS